MATWPHEPTTLSDSEKNAYRGLLYWAMLDIRNLCQSRGRESANPLEWRRQYKRSRLAGALADWLHNLAQHAAGDFKAFDTEWFWREYDGLCRWSQSMGPRTWIDYRERYEDYLAKAKKG
jgi:hypothetical protein